MNRKDLVILPRCLLQHIPVWEWSDESGAHEAYDEDNRILLEATYLENSDETLTFEDHGLKVRANLTTMQQQVLLDGGVLGPEHKIHRIDKKAAAAPAGQSEATLAISNAPADGGASSHADQAGQLVPYPLTKDGKKKKRRRRRSKKRDKKEGKKREKKKKRRRESSYSSYSGSSGSSYSGSSSASKDKGHRRRKRRRRTHKTSDGKGKGRGQRSRSRRPLQHLGNYGSGDHQADIEKFIYDNKLDDRTVDAIMKLDEWQQKAVMGTDGGQNSFVLEGKVNNPNAVVMSRIRKL